MSKRSSEDYGGSSSKKIKDGCKFKKHRNTFDEVYFTDSDIIQVGSKEYDDFWLFLDKYQHFKQIKKFSASSTYNKINKVNLCFNKNSKIKKCLIKEVTNGYLIFSNFVNNVIEYLFNKPHVHYDSMLIRI